MADLEPTSSNKPLYVRIFINALAIILGISAFAAVVGAVYSLINPNFFETIQSRLSNVNKLQLAVVFVLLGVVMAGIALGLRRYKNWARTILLAALLIFVIYYFVSVIFAISSSIFAGESVVPIRSIFWVIGQGLLFFAGYAIIPLGLIFSLLKMDQYFEESIRQRHFVDSVVRYILLLSS